MHRKQRQVGRLSDDEAVSSHSRSNQVRRANTTLELTDHVCDDDITAERDAGADHGCNRCKVRGVRGLHVRYSDAVDAAIPHVASKRVDGPADASWVRVQMPVEHQTGSVTASCQSADHVEAARLDLLEFRCQAHLPRVRCDEPRNSPLFSASGVAAEPHHALQQAYEFVTVDGRHCIVG